ncbi:MAG: hypothetical protein HGB12_11510 [Bacteroidetes bacterium]|nr:hypothetical protein [Bacteroidota bacterium]
MGSQFNSAQSEKILNSIQRYNNKINKVKKKN